MKTKEKTIESENLRKGCLYAYSGDLKYKSVYSENFKKTKTKNLVRYKGIIGDSMFRAFEFDVLNTETLKPESKLYLHKNVIEISISKIPNQPIIG